jgi:hypothetical protein
VLDPGVDLLASRSPPMTSAGSCRRCCGASNVGSVAPVFIRTTFTGTTHFSKAAKLRPVGV